MSREKRVTAGTVHQMIRDAAASGTATLRLANSGLTALPAEIGQLTNLQHLFLGGNQLTALPAEIGQLTNLQHLFLGGNQLTALPAEIGQLTNLQHLDLGGNQLTALPAEIAQLTNLQALALAGNQLTTLPAEIGQLTNLQTLDLIGSQLTALPAEIAQLTNLQALFLGGNQLTALPAEIAQLTNLQYLDLASNQLTALPVELGDLPKTVLLGLTGNPLHEPLPQLVERGTRELFTYLKSLARAQPQYEAKVLLVGEGNVGKSSLIAALHHEAFVENRPTTHGIEIGQLVLPHPDRAASRPDLTLNTWDFGGQEVYRITHQFFFSRRALYLLVWRPREGCEENAIEAWCTRIRLRVGGDARIMIVATHADERRAELDYPYLKRQFGDLLVGQYTVDNKSGAGLDALRQALAAKAAELPQMGERISQHWIAARDELKAIASPQISSARFAEICAAHGLDESQTRVLAELLHDLGHIIYYGDDDGLRDIVVLQPEWLTKAIGYVLEDPLIESNAGVVHHQRLRELWQDRRRDTSYEPRHHPYFLRLMEKFDVSYRIPDEDKSLVAQLVPYEEPELPWQHDAPVPERHRTLRMICRMAEAAPGLIAWLTVRNHRFSTGRHWRRGVFLEHRDHAAQALLTLDRDLELSLTVRAQSPDYFFSVLRDTLEDLIHRRWKGLSYELLVPCPTVLPNGSPCRGRYELQRLERYRIRDRSTIECHRCDEPHGVTELLTGFKLPDAPLQQVLQVVDERAEELKTELREHAADIKANQRAVAAEYAGETANQIRILLRAVTAELPDCPRLFTLLPIRPSRWQRLEVWQNRYCLTLWCEHPGHEHPWAQARYEFTRPTDWFRAVAPYALVISRLLRLAVPISSAALGTVLPADTLAGINDELDLMETVAEKALPGDVRKELADVGDEGWRSAEGGGLRALRALLVQLDSAMRFGDLRRVLAPSGDYLWVCPEDHYREYDPGLPTLPS